MTEPTTPIETNPPTATVQPTDTKPTPTITTKTNNPRITIQYCTQCKWMLRAAYFAQELLSTFSTDLGEVALIPSRGGVFTVTVFYSPSPSPFTSTSTSTGEENGDVKETVIWDRKRDGGFPEVKTLKSLVRNIIDPNRDLGHTDRALRAGTQAQSGTGTESKAEEEKKECEDCR